MAFLTRFGLVLGAFLALTLAIGFAVDPDSMRVTFDRFAAYFLDPKIVLGLVLLASAVGGGTVVLERKWASLGLTRHWGGLGGGEGGWEIDAENVRAFLGVAGVAALGIVGAALIVSTAQPGETGTPPAHDSAGRHEAGGLLHPPGGESNVEDSAAAGDRIDAGHARPASSRN